MPNFENQSELILYKYRRIVRAYVIQRNIEHRIHFVSNAWVDRGYEAENIEVRKLDDFCRGTFCSLSINITKSSHADQRCGTALTVRTKYGNASFDRPNRLRTSAYLNTNRTDFFEGIKFEINLHIATITIQ